MKKNQGIVVISVIFLLLIILFAILIKNGNLQLLNPQGYIAQKQSQILWVALILGLIIGSTIVGTTLLTAFSYRQEKSKRKYTPDWTGSKLLIFAWWALPAIFIAFLGGITWFTTHELDPYKPINSSVKPITVQVVALNWKWLFIYPDEKIATVNLLEFPVGTPINFQLTADAPMNSFWIPSLGGQIYAMAGMNTQLHLVADKIGEFQGGAAEINGDGFSRMNFIAKSVSRNDYETWIKTVGNNGKPLNFSTYNALAKPSMDNPKTLYIYTDQNLYNEIIMKFMKPTMDKTNEKTKTMQDSENIPNMPGM